MKERCCSGSERCCQLVREALIVREVRARSRCQRERVLHVLREDVRAISNKVSQQPKKLHAMNKTSLREHAHNARERARSA
jgi:hypothetical protein